MNRHDAYSILADTLGTYRGLAPADLVALVGRRSSDRVASAVGEEFLLDIVVEWVGEPGKAIRVRATVDSPSCFRLGRVEDEVVIRVEPS